MHTTKTAIIKLAQESIFTMLETIKPHEIGIKTFKQDISNVK